MYVFKGIRFEIYLLEKKKLQNIAVLIKPFPEMTELLSSLYLRPTKYAFSYLYMIEPFLGESFQEKNLRTPRKIKQMQTTKYIYQNIVSQDKCCTFPVPISMCSSLL